MSTDDSGTGEWTVDRKQGKNNCTEDEGIVQLVLMVLRQLLALQKESFMKSYLFPLEKGLQDYRPCGFLFSELHVAWG